MPFLPPPNLPPSPPVVAVAPPASEPGTLDDLTGEYEAKLLGEGLAQRQHQPLSRAVLQPIIWQNPENFQLSQGTTSPVNPTPEFSNSPPSSIPAESEPLETFADRQEYDTLRQLFNAIGDVFMRFREAELKADRVQTDLNENIVVAEGNVVLTRGDQIIRGERLEYNLILDRGVISQASGSLNVAQTQQFTSPNLAVPNRPTLPAIQSDTSSLYPENQLTVERLNFSADALEFDGRRWRATNLRVTNDIFSPPELEVRADTASLEPISPRNTRLIMERGRVVFDQSTAIPILREEFILGEQRDILPFQFGYDSQDRGGFYVSRRFNLVSNQRTRLSLSPEFYFQRAVDAGFDLTQSQLYGGTLQIEHRFTPTTLLRGYGLITDLDPDQWPATSRGNFLLRQEFNQGYSLNAQALYRERLINGSLGEQEIQSSVGGIFVSPYIFLGKTGLVLNLQASGNYITANSDVPSLGLQPGLGRLQGVINLYREFPIWRGETLPPTPEAGLRYTPNLLRPYLNFYVNGQAVGTYYTSGNTQPALQGTAGFRGQFGHLSRNWFDYTGFDIGYSQTFSDGGSPFLFDRIVDFSVLNVGARQQVYGPVLIGLTSQMNVDTGRFFNTNIFLEYSRRTYGVILRYNADYGIAGIVLRISGFNWQGNTNPLNSPNLGIVNDGVIRPGR